MGSEADNPKDRVPIQLVLGYLNFSSGVADPRFLNALDQLFGEVASPDQRIPAWRQVCGFLEAQLSEQSRAERAFADVTQASSVLDLLTNRVLSAYRSFHSDLLFHQDEQLLFGPFFVGRAFEAILQQGPPWDDRNRITEGAIATLNDYIGYRPVPALETRRHEPYSHEWVRPIPLYVRGAGVQRGPCQRVVTEALAILEATDADILDAAHFDFSRLDELAVDPRAYDFDHPVNKRPNYHFGQWDPHCIDNAGYYRRFVVQQITLDGLLDRVRATSDVSEDQLFFEAAAVLAGTILMASGISGSGPTTHDSSITLGVLLPIVAEYRDAFYDRLIQRARPEYRSRLQEEFVRRRQPFGGARQHLNAWLARQRASQLQHVHLAKIFARMGYPAAAGRQTTIVPVASARMRCEIDCCLTAGSCAIGEGRLEQAVQLADEIVDVLHRGIECGAIVDPWNILGFDAHFSLFPALENSVYDHRVDDLVQLIENLLGYYSDIWSSAAAIDRRDVCQAIDRRFRETATWWRQFAAHEVSVTDAVDGLEVYRAAQNVADALTLWHEGGAAAGDVKFWAPHVHMFTSPKAFSLVVDALLKREDFIASMALLVRWLSESERVSLRRGASSFYDSTQQWLLRLLARVRQPAGRLALPEAPGRLVGKFFDYLEANAESYWNAPDFHIGGSSSHSTQTPLQLSDGLDEDEESEDDLFSAAYEEVVYCDSTDDGVEGEVFDLGETTHDELTQESRRISDRLAFLNLMAGLWKQAAVNQALCSEDASQKGPFDCVGTLRQWIQHTVASRDRLLKLMDDVRHYRIPTNGVDSQALREYDRLQVVKETLLDRIVATSVEMTVAGQMILAAFSARSDSDGEAVDEMAKPFGDDASVAVRVMAALLRGDNESVKQHWAELIHGLSGKALLYIPLSKGGSPIQIVATRYTQRLLQDLLAWLPRRGLWTETCELVETARRMERNNPVGPGAVTEFDELFKIAYRELIESLTISVESWSVQHRERRLVELLESLTEVMLGSWLQHSRTLRLSVLEHINDDKTWEQLVQFIERYGEDLFTQQFFHLGNLRAILHQGVGNWLRRLAEAPDTDEPIKLVQDLGRGIEPHRAEEHLSLILETIVENFGEYRDYNSTTTQSDHGQQLYTLIDFLRLRTQYDRVCWHLKPVILGHEILVRRGHEVAAGLWRRTLLERIDEEADAYVTRLKQLQSTYSMHMSTVADRIGERFVRPMIIDRLRALVKPAMEDSTEETGSPAFDLLEKETEALADEATGIGFDVPVWLLAIEEEVDRAGQITHQYNYQRAIASAVPRYLLSREEIETQLERCNHDHAT